MRNRKRSPAILISNQYGSFRKRTGQSLGNIQCLPQKNAPPESFYFVRQDQIVLACRERPIRAGDITFFDKHHRFTGDDRAEQNHPGSPRDCRHLRDFIADIGQDDAGAIGLDSPIGNLYLNRRERESLESLDSGPDDGGVTPQKLLIADDFFNSKSVFPGKRPQRRQDVRLYVLPNHLVVDAAPHGDR